MTLFSNKVAFRGIKHKNFNIWGDISQPVTHTLPTVEGNGHAYTLIIAMWYV